MKKTNEIFIGCSGYYYPQWKGTFYPQKLSASKWLEHYSTVFNTVELNGTFYRIPKLTDLQRQYNHTPDEFRFSVKMNRYITHTLKLKNAGMQINEFQALMKEALMDKLHKFLFQMPPSFHYSEQNLELICSTIPEGNQNVIELRHASWWNETVELAFKQRAYTFCNVDYPGLKTHFIHTSNDLYLRLHGSPELFKSAYTETQLENYFEEFPKEQMITVYFNNTYYEAAYKNALFLKSKFKST
jgi:uncharacterized protein YecE (DUF72 family)